MHAKARALKHMAEHDSGTVEIIPGLHISSLAGALSVKPETCRSMLCLCDERLRKNPVADKLNIDWKLVRIADDEQSDILPYLHQCLTFIDEALWPVLVYSFRGCSRAPTIVAAYLVITQEVTSVREALQLIQSKRPQVQPNANFVRQLGRFAAAAQSCSSGASIGSIREILDDARTVECSMDVEMLAQETRARPEFRTSSGTNGMSNGTSIRSSALSESQTQVSEGEGAITPYSAPRNRIAELRARKAQAIADEDFETAARLRDEIKELEKEGPSLEELEEMKRKAIANDDFEMAATLRDAIRGGGLPNRAKNSSEARRPNMPRRNPISEAERNERLERFIEEKLARDRDSPKEISVKTSEKVLLYILLLAIAVLFIVFVNIFLRRGVGSLQDYFTDEL